MHTSKKSILILLLLWTPCLTTPSEEDKGYEIAKKVQMNLTGYKKYYAEMDMELIKENGKSFHRKIKTYHLEQKESGEKTINIFEDPADVKGTKLFSQPDDKNNVDDQWIFLPALHKTKRIANENKSGPFMGSELAFEDLGSYKLNKFTYKFMGTKTRNGREHLILWMYPTSKYSGYDHIVSWIDKDKYIPAYSEYFDKRNELVKVQEEDHKQFGKFYLATRLKVHNQKTGKETIISWKNFNFNVAIDEAMFSSTGFERMN